MSYLRDDPRVRLNHTAEGVPDLYLLGQIFQEEMDQEHLLQSLRPRSLVMPEQMLPAYLVLGVDGYTFMLNHLEEQMDQPVNPRTIIADILDAIRQEQFALQELEYHCLGLLEEAALGKMYNWFEPMVDYIHHVGRELHRGLRDNRAYLDGAHPYHLHQLRANGVYLQRKDLFQKEVQKELEEHETPRPQPGWAPVAAPAPREATPVYRLTF